MHIIDKREEFSTAVKLAAVRRSNGVCECRRLALKGVPGFSPDGCGRRLYEGNIFFDHIVPDAIEGRPSLDNCAVLTKTCMDRKSRLYDRPVTDKARRMRARSLGIKEVRHPMPCGRRSAWKKPVGLYSQAMRR